MLLNEDLVKEKFERIKSIGWIPNTKTQNGHGGHGNTLESSFGVIENNKKEPDWKNFEIKSVKDSKSSSNISLFSSIPDHPEGADRYLWEKYGKVDENGLRRFYSTLRGTEIETQSGGDPWSLVYGKNYIKIRLCDSDKRVYLVVQNLEREEVEKDIYWTYENLEEKTNKMKDIIFGNLSESRKSEGKDEYKWDSLNVFWNLNFTNFLNEIRYGNIVFDIRCGVYKDKKKYGKIHDRGSAFRMKYKNFVQICNRIYEHHRFFH